MAGMTKAKDAMCIKCLTLAGTTASGTITATGIATEDTLIAVIEIATSTGIPTDRTSTTSITAANQITCSVNTTADKLIVLYNDNSA